MNALPAIFVACLAVAGPTAMGQGRLTVDAAKPGVKISPTFYGLMTEEINHAYDGGLYAELIQNRAFADRPSQPIHWSLIQDGGATAEMQLNTEDPAPKRSLHLHVTACTQGQRAGIANDGFWGIRVLPNTRYRARLDIAASSESQGPVDVSIESNDGKTVFAHASLSKIERGSHTYSVVLRTGRVAPSATNRLVVSVGHPGDYIFSFVSLFPPTFHNRPNGLRPDLMVLLGGLHPAFLRLPGGNYLEGNHISERFEWDKTVGDVAARPGHPGPWGYRSSDGLGMLEFLEWCEDLRMQPVLAVYAGYSLQGEHVAPGPDLEPYVREALANIEYVIGDPKTGQGALRASNGHLRPFPLTYVEIGNEDAFDRSNSYDARFAQFYDAIRAKFPQLKIIATMPVTTRVPDVIDDHYYRTAEAMARDAHHYDGYSRSGPKIFVGEWASTEGRPTPTLQAALGDAAWLTGLERNSDVVVMEAYAPLLVNVNPGAAQWGTNLIGYDALSSFGSPSYYVQSMFGANAGDVVLPVKLEVPAPIASAAPEPHGAIGLGTWRTNAVYRNVSVTQNGERIFPTVVGEGAVGWTFRRGQWTAGDGFIQQTSLQSDTRATIGDPAWTNYTYRLQARKVSGDEGFLIQFHMHDGAFWQWNVGGWNDTRTALQRVEGGSAEEVGPSSAVTIQPGHFYDIRVELENRHIRCFLDGKLISEAEETPRPPLDPVYATASRDLKTGDVILKVVNVSSNPQPLELDVNGVDLAGEVRGWELAGRPEDQNSVKEPAKVSPHPIQTPSATSTVNHTFPPYSVTVLRFPTHRQ